MTEKRLVARWVTGVVAAAVALVISPVRFTPSPATLSAPGSQPAGGGAMAPDTVLRHPNPARPLAERWEWARVQARRLGGRSVWIGYLVRSSLLVDLRGTALSGVPLAQLVGQQESANALALLFRFTAGRQPALVRVHAGSFYSPVEVGSEGAVALIWLGGADDAASLSRLKTLYAEAPTADVKEAFVNAAGLHGSTAVVVPLLDRWSADAEPPNVRVRAATWLRHHGRGVSGTPPRPVAKGRPALYVRTSSY